MKAYERLLKYVEYDTASDANSETCPSTKSQLEFGADIVKEMIDLGISDASMDENGYIFGTIPSNIDKKVPTIGFIAHMDVVKDAPSANIKPQMQKNYDGKTIVLKDGVELSPEEFPELKNYVGMDLITTDGTTLLGADDKAGIANILTAAEKIINDPSIKHGTIKIGFTPDEEIGRGADLFNVKKFGADFAYTCDGGAFGEIEYETFNAASLKVTVKGISIHPGSAKDKMINSMLVAHEYISMLPAMARPERTEGYQGFIHLTSIKGEIENTVMEFIIRDHDENLLNLKKDYAVRVAEELCKKYGEGMVVAEVKDEYRNMKDMILPNFHLIDTAFEAIKELGGTPICHPVRGGTDGCRLSFMGLPCPNFGTGGHNCHGKREYVCIQEMDKTVELIIKIAEKYSKKDI